MMDALESGFTNAFFLIVNSLIAVLAYVCGCLIRSSFEKSNHRVAIYIIAFILTAILSTAALFLIFTRVDVVEADVISSIISALFFIGLGLFLNRTKI